MALTNGQHARTVPDVFLIGLSGGSQDGDNRGLFAGNTTAVKFPDDLTDNATVLTMQQTPVNKHSHGYAVVIGILTM